MSSIHLLKGRPKRMILEGEILAAQGISKSEAEAADKLGVSFMTYRKYARMYGVYGRVSNKAGKGVKKGVKNEESGKFPLTKVLNGDFPKYSTNRLKVRLLRTGKILPVCNKCGFKEERIGDRALPLLLNYMDGNDKNKKFENLEFLCYNCFFLYVNNPFGQRKKSFKCIEHTQAAADASLVPVPDPVSSTPDITATTV